MIVYERESASMVLWMGKELVEEMGVASTRKPEMTSVLERQVRVMEESLTSEIRTRRGGLISWGGRGWESYETKGWDVGQEKREGERGYIFFNHWINTWVFFAQHKSCMSVSATEDVIFKISDCHNIGARDLLSSVVTSPWSGLLVREFFKA